MKKSRTLIILALLLTLITTFLLYQYIESLRRVPEVKIEYGKVVMAATNIPEQMKITTEMLIVKDLPKEAIHLDSTPNVADLVGRTTKVEIQANEQLLKSKVAGDDEKTGLSFKIPENMRAIVVPTDEVSGLAGYLTKGDKVDILVTYVNQTTPGTSTIPATTQPGETVPATTPQTTPGSTGTVNFVGDYIETITQFQNIEILEVGIKATVDENGNIVKAQGVPSSVALLVTPPQAEIISYMLTYGSFQMTLRNPVDGIKVPLDHYGKDNFLDWRNR